MKDIPIELYDRLFDFYRYKLRTKYPDLSLSVIEDKAHDLTKKELESYNENEDRRRLLDAI